MEVKWSGQFMDIVDYEFTRSLEERIIILNEDVQDTLVEKVIMQILRWNREDEGKSIDERKNIEIVLNSPGGDVYLGMVICDVIQNSVTPVHVRILGMAASLGGLIAIAGHKTSAYKHSNVLIHDGSTVIFGSTNKAKDHMKFQELKDQQIKDFVISNTNISPEKYDEMSDREWWLTAQEALELGIVQELI